MMEYSKSLQFYIEEHYSDYATFVDMALCRILNVCPSFLAERSCDSKVLFIPNHITFWVFRVPTVGI